MKIPVLDKGYVTLVDHMGNDLSVVNAARASFDKESKVMDSKDEGLIKFLLREGHNSPFRHAQLSFEVKAPLMVARQMYKYVVGSSHLGDGNSWNENSYRYLSLPQDFYVPAEWRSKPLSAKQGSGDALTQAQSKTLSETLTEHVRESLALYDGAIAAGVAPEQARLFLPAYGLYVTWRWSASLSAVLHFLQERLASDAQDEIRQYAGAIYELTEQLFPKTIEFSQIEKA